jgi:hypothetical protein
MFSVSLAFINITYNISCSQRAVSRCQRPLPDSQRPYKALRWGSQALKRPIRLSEGRVWLSKGPVSSQPLRGPYHAPRWPCQTRSLGEDPIMF